MKRFLPLLLCLPLVAFTQSQHVLSLKENFGVTDLPPLPGGEAPSLAWKDSTGLVAQAAGNFFFLPDRSREWQGIEGDLISTGTTVISAAGNGKLYVVEGIERYVLSLVNNRVVREDLAYLPVEVKAGSAVFSRGSLYVAGRDGEGKNIFLRDSLRLEPWSNQPARLVVIAESQGTVYVFADEDGSGRLSAYAFNPNLNIWSALGTSEFPVFADVAFACGDAHILFVGPGAEKLLGFYTTQKKWVAFDLPGLPLDTFAVVSEYNQFSLLASENAFLVKAILPGTKYGIFDHLIVFAFFAFMLWVGKYLSKREETGNDFFRGGQRLPWWAVGLSMFATGASAISLMAMPAKAYMENWIYVFAGIFQLFLLPLTFLFIIPIARRLKFKTAYEYLEVRFSHSVRILGSLIYVGMQLFGRMATIMLLPSVALSAICGIPMEISILIMGGVTTLYCTMGGFEAVVWTDVIQAIVMLLAIILCVVWVVVTLDSSPDAAWQLVMAENKLQMVDFSWDVTQPIIYIIFINSVFTFFGNLGDQNFIQRVQATPTERQARKAVTTQLTVAVPLNLCLFGLGTLLFIYYNQNPEDISPAMKADGIFPLFAAQKLPTGLAGIVVAALMAATMSTLSSALNSVSNIAVDDYVRRFKPDLTERGAVVWGKWLTIMLGIFGTGMSLLLAKSSIVSIWDLIILITGMLFAPMTAIYILGTMTRRANSVGAWGGTILAVAGTAYCNFNLNLHPFFIPVISMSLCLVTGYLISLVFTGPARDLTGLTVYSLPKKNDDY